MSANEKEVIILKFSENLIRLRKARGLSQEDIGNELNVARQTISKWENGETSPDLQKLTELSDFFGVSIDSLCGRSDESIAVESSASESASNGYYEYVSKRSVLGLPLVHIKLGANKFCRAKGIIAIGNSAVGMIAVGGASVGVVSIGGAAIGLISVGGAALGLALAFGGISLGAVAIGGAAAGLFAVGGFAAGIYSIGGFAAASKIAMSIDGFSAGKIAIGSHAMGGLELPADVHSADEIYRAILDFLPRTPRWIAKLFAAISGK